MPSLSRRGFLVLGGTGAAGVALAACGSTEDPRADGDDAELLSAAREAETLYGAAAKAFADQQGVSRLIVKASAARAKQLGELSDGAGPGAGGGSGGSKPDAAALAAIAAYRQGARLLSSTDARATATRFLGQVAAELATLRGLLGDGHQVPYAFVTGLPEPPLATTEDAPGVDTTSTTSTTSTTTTSTGEGG